MKVDSIEHIEDKKIVKAVFSGTMISSSDNTLFKEIFDENLEKNIKNFLLSFSDIEFINSSALGRIILDYKRIKKENGKIAVYDLQKDVLEVFKITRLDKVLNIFNSEEEALNYLRCESS